MILVLNSFTNELRMKGPNYVIFCFSPDTTSNAFVFSSEDICISTWYNSPVAWRSILYSTGLLAANSPIFLFSKDAVFHFSSRIIFLLQIESELTFFPLLLFVSIVLKMFHSPLTSLVSDERPVFDHNLVSLYVICHISLSASNIFSLSLVWFWCTLAWVTLCLFSLMFRYHLIYGILQCSWNLSPSHSILFKMAWGSVHC